MSIEPKASWDLTPEQQRSFVVVTLGFSAIILSLAVLVASVVYAVKVLA